MGRIHWKSTKGSSFCRMEFFVKTTSLIGAEDLSLGGVTSWVAFCKLTSSGKAVDGTDLMITFSASWKF